MLRHQGESPRNPEPTRSQKVVISLHGPLTGIALFGSARGEGNPGANSWDPRVRDHGESPRNPKPTRRQKVVISLYGPITGIALFGSTWGEGSPGANSWDPRVQGCDYFFRGPKKIIASPKALRLLEC